MSPLLVARAPYDIKGVELATAIFIGCGMWAELNINGGYWHNVRKHASLIV